MLIVEGPDGAGKTTLINELLRLEPDLQLSPRVVSKEAKATTDLQAWVENDLSSDREGVVYDRYRLISQPIYGAVLRNEEPGVFGDLEWLITMNQALRAKNPVIVHCLPPIEVVRANVKDDPDNTAVADRIDQLYIAYATRATTDLLTPGLHTIIYNYAGLQQMTEEEVARNILTLYSARETEQL